MRNRSIHPFNLLVALFIAAMGLAAVFGNLPAQTPLPPPGKIGDMVLNSLTIQDRMNYGVDAGSTDAYVATINPAPLAYGVGALYVLKAATANTGAASVNFNGLGVKTIVKAVSTTLANNDILAGMLCLLVYDGTNMVLLNPRVL